MYVSTYVHVHICLCGYGFFVSFFTSIPSSDIDECLGVDPPCSQKCANSEGSFVCSCFKGYTLAEDRATCDGESWLQWWHWYLKFWIFIGHSVTDKGRMCNDVLLIVANESNLSACWNSVMLSFLLRCGWVWRGHSQLYCWVRQHPWRVPVWVSHRIPTWTRWSVLWRLDNLNSSQSVCSAAT